VKFCENSATLSAELSIPQCGGVVRERHGSVNLVEPSLEIFSLKVSEDFMILHGKIWKVRVAILHTWQEILQRFCEICCVAEFENLSFRGFTKRSGNP
jgi:hypothetical protein